MVFRKSLPILYALAAFCAITLNARADIPTDPAVRAKSVGTPKSLLVHPPSFLLSGSRATAQPVVTGVYGDGTVRDLTHFADLKIKGDVATIDAERYVTAKKNGKSVLTVSAGGQSVNVEVTVENFDKPTPVSFRNEVVAASTSAAASGAHGTPTGKSG